MKESLIIATLAILTVYYASMMAAALHDPMPPMPGPKDHPVIAVDTTVPPHKISRKYLTCKHCER